MSGDKLSKRHVQGQMPLQSETFKQSQADVDQVHNHNPPNSTLVGKGVELCFQPS